jgi:hypothetical protein
VRKALHNAVGWLLPVIVAVVATPWLIRTMGDNLARFVVEVIDKLDLSELVDQYAGRGLG